MLEVLLDALIDSLKTLPFLLLVYVLVEVIEHTASSKVSAKLLRGKLSPLIGAGVGVIPQCGFSVVATKLYTGRAIALGTLLAVYLSTSDEAVVVLMSDFSAIGKLLPLIGIKVAYAVAVGYVVNFFVRKRALRISDERVSAVGCHHHVVGDEGDREGERDPRENRKRAIKRYVLHPVLHSSVTFLYILIVNVVFGAIIYGVGEEALTAFMTKIDFLQPLLAALVGLIPNCAASVVITQMYAIGTLSLGGALSGLCVSAGLGLAVLVKENGSVKDTLVVIGLLFLLSVTLGTAVTAISMLF